MGLLRRCSESSWNRACLKTSAGVPCALRVGRQLPAKVRRAVRLIDAVSIEGFAKSLRRRVCRIPPSRPGAAVYRIRFLARPTTYLDADRERRVITLESR